MVESADQPHWCSFTMFYYFQKQRIFWLKQQSKKKQQKKTPSDNSSQKLSNIADTSVPRGRGFGRRWVEGLWFLAVLCECVRVDRARLFSVLQLVLFQLRSLGDSGERSRGEDISDTQHRERHRQIQNNTHLLQSQILCYEIQKCRH